MRSHVDAAKTRGQHHQHGEGLDKVAGRSGTYAGLGKVDDGAIEERGAHDMSARVPLGGRPLTDVDQIASGTGTRDDRLEKGIDVSDQRGRQDQPRGTKLAIYREYDNQRDREHGEPRAGPNPVREARKVTGTGNRMLCTQRATTTSPGSTPSPEAAMVSSTDGLSKTKTPHKLDGTSPNRGIAVAPWSGEPPGALTDSSLPCGNSADAR